jgi:hypothetical protein
MKKRIFFPLLFCSMLISCQQDKNALTEHIPDYKAADLMAMARESAAKYGLEDSVEMFFLVKDSKTPSKEKLELTEAQLKASFDTFFTKTRASIDEITLYDKMFKKRWDMLLRIQSKREYFESLEQDPDLFRWTYREKGIKKHLADKAKFLSDKWFLAVDKEGAVVWTPEPYEGEGRRINQQ